MNKVIRLIISVPLAALVATLVATLLLLIITFFDSASVSKGQRETAFWVSLFGTILPALLTGAVIPIFNLRPLLGAITGAAAQMLLLLVIALLMANNINPMLRMVYYWSPSGPFFSGPPELSRDVSADC